MPHDTRTLRRRDTHIRRPGNALVALLTAGCLALLAVLGGSGPAVAATRRPLPTSMAATGDSISVAFDVNWLHVLRTAPEYSWSTGTKASVASHYERILARSPAIRGHAYNNAVRGARMADLDAQARAAASRQVQYLTVLMGANDVCRSTIADMTPTTTFAAQFRTALADFTRADPGAAVLVASIPNLYQLWSVLQGSWTARHVWSLLGICPVMLGAGVTPAQREQVLARIVADNTALAEVCAQFSQCRFDGGATFAYRFSASRISTVDYFHPDAAGETALAALTWGAGYWPTL